MWLAIDIGNTNIHMGIFEEDTLVTENYIRCENSEMFYVNLQKNATPFLREIKAAVISSVNPKIEYIVTGFIQKRFSFAPKIIGKDVPLIIDICSQEPEKVGSDRLLNALAAFECTKDWTIIIDAGTAITIDLVNEKGGFLGGVIAPGISMSSKALKKQTALLPKVQIERPENVLGKNTTEAINSGVYWGTIGMVEKLVTMICYEVGRQPVILSTGGDANMLAREITLVKTVMPNLTLEGIKFAYNKYLLS